MNPDIVSRIIRLIDQTGDKIIMMDPATERTVVIMDLAAYEKMAAGQDLGSVGSDQPEARSDDGVRVSESVSVASSSIAVSEATVSREETLGQSEERRATETDESAEAGQLVGVSEAAEIESFIRPQKKPSIYVNSGQRDPLAESAFSDLTQTELLDKINRDIAAWKTAQDRKRTDELRAAASQGQALSSADALEEEERFYLEPID